MALVFGNLVLEVNVFDQDYILPVLISFLSILCFGTL